MTDRLVTLVCPNCGCSDVVFKEVTTDGDLGAITVSCSGCGHLWPQEAPTPAVLPELVRLGAQLETQLHRATIRRELGHTLTAVQWENRASRTSLAIRDLLEGAAA